MSSQKTSSPDPGPNPPGTSERSKKELRAMFDQFLYEEIMRLAESPVVAAQSVHELGVHPREV